MCKLFNEFYYGYVSSLILIYPSQSPLLIQSQSSHILMSDTVLGVFLVWLLLRASSNFAYTFDIPSLKEQGYYDDPPSWCFYIVQLFIFLSITLISKFILGLLFFSFEVELDIIGAYICLPFKSNPDAELTFVMAICPSVLNIIQVLYRDDPSVSSLWLYIYVYICTYITLPYLLFCAIASIGCKIIS